MHVVVVGAGAVGGYFGGRLAQANTPVTFLVRQHRYEQLKNKGLTVKSVHGDFTIKPTLATSPEEIDSPDVVILAVKNYHLQKTMPQLRILAAKGAKILPLLNGVEHMERLTEEVGKEVVLGGSCYVESTLDPEGTILQTSPMQDIVFGSLGDVSQEWLQTLLELFQASGVNAKLSEAILKDMWTKFVFLTSISGLTAAARAPVGVIVGDTASRQLLQYVIREVLQVANARGVELPVEETAQQTIAKMEQMSPNMTSSLHRDLEKGLPLEIESLQGSVVRMGAASGIPVPFIQSVYALLHPYVNGRTSQ